MIELLKKVRSGEYLTADETSSAILSMVDGKMTPSQIGALLMGMAQRGESVEELTGAALTLRCQLIPIKAPDNTIDCCGTGGDHSGTLNISTAVAFVAAACGVPVAKHGNRAASSKSGAADVLEALGIQLNLNNWQCEEALRRFNFCFLMAPHHHHALKPLAPIRKELGFRTLFNLMGPLANPAGAKRQLVGVFSKDWIMPIAQVLNGLGTEKAWVVHGSDGLDEVTLSGETHCACLDHGKIDLKVLNPNDFGLPVTNTQDIHGGDASYNAQAIISLLNGELSGYRNVVLANTAVTLVIAGKVSTLKEGVSLAADAINSGRAMNVLKHYTEFSKVSE